MFIIWVVIRISCTLRGNTHGTSSGSIASDENWNRINKKGGIGLWPVLLWRVQLKWRTLITRFELIKSFLLRIVHSDLAYIRVGLVCSTSTSTLHMFEWFRIMIQLSMCHSQMSRPLLFQNARHSQPAHLIPIMPHFCLQQKCETSKTEIIKKWTLFACSLWPFLLSSSLLFPKSAPKIYNFRLTCDSRQTHSHSPNGHKLADDFTNEFVCHWLCVYMLVLGGECRLIGKQDMPKWANARTLNSNHPKIDHMSSVPFPNVQFWMRWTGATSERERNRQTIKL